jgi:hypothetical protein
MTTVFTRLIKFFVASCLLGAVLSPAARATVITSTSGTTTTYTENFNGGSSFSSGWVNTILNNDDYMWLTALNPTSSFSFSSASPISIMSLSFWYSVPGANNGEVEFADSGVVSLGDTPGSILQFSLNNPGPSTGGIGGAFDSQFFGSVANLGAGMYTITFSTAGHLFDGLKVDDVIITTNAVPEPASLAIFGLGMLGVALTRNRSRMVPKDELLTT